MSLAQLSVSSWDSFLTTEVTLQVPKASFSSWKLEHQGLHPSFHPHSPDPYILWHPGQWFQYGSVDHFEAGCAHWAKNTTSQHYPLLLLLLFPLRSLELHLVKLFWYLGLVNTIYSRSVKILLVKRLQKCNFMQFNIGNHLWNYVICEHTTTFRCLDFFLQNRWKSESWRLIVLLKNVSKEQNSTATVALSKFGKSSAPTKLLSHGMYLVLHSI